ncbi:MAG: hypothetical protein AB1500_05695 [Bacillota bacterium]
MLRLLIAVPYERTLIFEGVPYDALVGTTSNENRTLKLACNVTKAELIVAPIERSTILKEVAHAALRHSD